MKQSRLTLIDILCLGVNAIIGSGIFLFPGKLYKEAGASSVLAFLVCGLLLTTVALCYAELGSMFHRNGGVYVFAHEAFGPQIGFVIGWIAWVTAVFSWAAVANAISAYLSYFHAFFGDPWVIKAIACSLILFFGTINYFGVKLGAFAVNLFTASKLLPLLLFVVVGSFYVSAEPLKPAFQLDMSTFGYAVFLSLWPLQGFETTPVAAGESSRPQRDIPMAAIGSLVFATVFYTLIQIVAVGSFPGLATAEKPLADAATLFMGVTGGSLIALGAVISMTGYSAGNALGSPRYLEALAHDRFLPATLANRHVRYQTPSTAIVLTTGLTAFMALFLNFDKLVDMANVAVISQYLSACVAVLVLRYRRPELERPFRIPGGWGLPVAGCLVTCWLIQQVKPAELTFTIITVVVGVILSLIYRSWAAKQP